MSRCWRRRISFRSRVVRDLAAFKAEADLIVANRLSERAPRMWRKKFLPATCPGRIEPGTEAFFETDL